MRIPRIACVNVFMLASAISAGELHVATNGNDSNPGTPTAPFRTIQHAADLAQPGDVITVHEGVYRERINPPRGGESDTKRIVYQSASGEKVEIKGSEVVKNWEKAGNDVWKVVLPNSFFGAFNPYADLIHGDWFQDNGRAHHTGAVYLNGEQFSEAANLDELLSGTATSHVPGSYLVNVAWIRPMPEGAQIGADQFAEKHGMKTAPCAEGGQCLGYIEAGNWARYERVDFGKRSTQVEIRAASVTGGGKIELRLDSPTGELLGTCLVEDTGDWQAWASFQAAIKPASGVKTLCLVFARHGQSPLWFGQVDPEKTTLWAQFKGVDPNNETVEINVRKTVFYPDKPGRNYITVRGFTMSNAATPWAPPTAEQVGLIGTHWSKGWIIEDNVISHSICSGVALGKYGDEWDNKAGSAEGYVGTINRALANGWSKEKVGGHIVRRNEIFHCGQTGIVGSLGAAFSTVSGNSIHDINLGQSFSGAEMAGIKFHGAVDVEISRNHIYRCSRGLWLDWMAQGTRVSANLFHNNVQQDFYPEVDHGPILVDNNIFLSPNFLFTESRGCAFVHNLIAGGVRLQITTRKTPFLKAHSTEVVGLHDTPCGDDRFYNNIFVQTKGLDIYDVTKLPVWMEGNVFLKGARPSKHETAPLLKADFDPAIKLIAKGDEYHLQITLAQALADQGARQLITSKILGVAAVPNVPFENPDGSPISINTDYFGKPRNESNPTAGPFEQPGDGRLDLKVW